MKTDEQLKKDVAAELAWDPAINTTHIGVAGVAGVRGVTNVRSQRPVSPPDHH